jgi:DNA-binding response OmpR family regulator
LIVDDEPTICRALQIALTRAGFSVDTRETGEGALELLRAEHVDALIVDLRIPDLRGDVLFELAVSVQSHLKYQTLFISGDASARGVELIQACGCPVVFKPFDLRDLVQETDKLVRRARDASA